MSYIGNRPVDAIGVRTGSTNPTSGSIGELFYNTVANELYLWDGSAWGGVSGGSSVPTGSTLPGSGAEGQLFYLTTDDKVYYHTGTDWRPMVGANTGSTVPGTGTTGDLFFDTVTQTLYVWNGTAWAVVGGASTVNSGAVTPGAGTNVGDLFYNTVATVLYLWDGSAWQIVSTVTGSNIPTGPSLPGSAADGELFYNTTTDKLYLRANGVWVSISPGDSPSGSSLPGSGTTGQVYYNTTDGTLYVWNGTAWVQVGGESVKTIEVGATLPGSGSPGDIYYQTSDNILYGWNDTAWVSLMAGSSGVPTGATLPGSAADGELFYNTTNNELYVRSAGAWKSLMTVVVTSGSSYPVSPTTGQTFFNTVDGVLYIWNGTAWVPMSSGSASDLSVGAGNSVSYSPTTSMSSFFTAPSTSGRRYIVTSVQVTNISGADEYVSAEIYNSTTTVSYSIGTEIPMPAGSSLELLKQHKVLQPNDEFRLQASNNGALSVAAAYATNSDAKNFGTGIDLTTTSLTDVYVASAKTKIDSILLSNDGALDTVVTVAWTNNSNAVQAYYCYELVIPANSTVELMEQSKIIASGHKIRASAGFADTIEVYVSGVTA